MYHIFHTNWFVSVSDPDTSSIHFVFWYSVSRSTILAQHEQQQRSHRRQLVIIAKIHIPRIIIHTTRTCYKFAVQFILFLVGIPRRCCRRLQRLRTAYHSSALVNVFTLLKMLVVGGGAGSLRHDYDYTILSMTRRSVLSNDWVGVRRTHSPDGCSAAPVILLHDITSKHKY